LFAFSGLWFACCLFAPEGKMRTTQIWILLAILLGAIVGSLWIAFGFYTLSEQQAWLACIKAYDPTSAQNLVCRSQFPRPFKQWALEYQGQTNATKGLGFIPDQR
jgi:hypothetical protein